MSVEPLRYGARVLLYRQAQDGYVVSTASAESPVGLRRVNAPGRPLAFEQAIFVIEAGDAASVAAGGGAPGDVVKYGHTVRLRHQAYQQPLAHHTELHAMELKGNLRVLLERRGESMYVWDRWRVMPRYRLRVEGEPVAGGDPVLLQSPDGERFLNISGTSAGAGLEAEATASMTGPNSPKSAMMPPGSASAFAPSEYEVSVGTELQGFQMRLYDGDVGPQFPPSVLRCGDCITLLHTEEHKYAQVDAGDSGTCILRSAENRADTDDPDAAGANADDEFLFRNRTVSKDDITFHALFVVEALDPSRGGALRATGREMYRLKCLSSGLYLQTGAVRAESHNEAAEAPDDVGGGGNVLEGPDNTSVQPQEGGEGTLPPTTDSYVVSLTEDPTSPGTAFIIQSASASAAHAEFLQSGSRIFLQAANTPSGGLWLVAGTPINDGTSSTEVTVASAASNAVLQGSVEWLGRAQRSLRDGLEVRRLPPKASEELNLIRGLLPPLERFIAEMAVGSGDWMRVREVQENLLQLRRLCFQRSDGETGGAASYHSDVPNPAWQAKMFNQGVPEVVLQVAKATLECPHVDVKLLSSSDMVTVNPNCKERFVPMRYTELNALVEMCFSFLGNLVSNRPRYAESLREYTDFLVSSCQHVPAAMQCLGVFFHKNPVYIELPMAKKQLQYFLSLLEERGRDAGVLKIIRLFTLCGEESMLEAQKVVLDHFLGSPSLTKRIFCEFKMLTAGEIHVQPGEGVLAPLKSAASFGNQTNTGNASAVTAVSTGSGGNPLQARKGPALVTELTTGSQKVVKVGIPNAMFMEQPSGDAMSIASSAQHRGHDGALDELLLTASTSEDVLGYTYFPIDGLRAVASDWPEVKDTFVPYLVEEVSLLASLAAGGNKRAAEELVERWVPMEVLVAATGSAALPTRLHAAFVELLAHLTAVSVPRVLHLRRDLRNVRCVIDASTAATKRMAIDSYEFSLDPIPPTLQHAKDVALRHVRGTPMSGDEHASQQYLAVLHLLGVLLDAGAFPLDEYEPLSAALAYAIDPKTDDKATQLEVHLVHECKVKAIRILGQMMDILLCHSALRMVDHFRGRAPPLPLSQLFQLSVHGTPLERKAIGNSTTAAEDAGWCGCGCLHCPNVPSCQTCFRAFCCCCCEESDDEPEYEYDDPNRPHKKGAIGTIATVGHNVLDRKNWKAGYRGATKMITTFAADRDIGNLVNKLYVGLTTDKATVGEYDPVALLSKLLEVAQDLAATTRSTRVRFSAQNLFFRLTNFVEELNGVATRVQLLTSEESIGFYTDINRTAAALDAVCKKSFRRANTFALANKALDSLDGFLSVSEYGAAVEKLAMMRHVGIPESLINMLQRLTLPVDEPSRQLTFKTVTLLQSLAQDSAICEDLRDSVELVSPLAAQNTNLLSLYRTLFIENPDERHSIPRSVLVSVVDCMSTTHTSATAVEFLTDLLSATDSSGLPIMQNQQAVWRAIVSDPESVRYIQFKNDWCNAEGGRALRERIISSKDYYMATGQMSRHLALLRLIYLIAVKNELVKPDELCHEAFGVSSLDAVLEVTTDAQMPAFFRKAYVQLIVVLVLEDAKAVPNFLAHRMFSDFLFICKMDCYRYLQLCGGDTGLPDVDEELERREDMCTRCQPDNDYERELDDARFGRNLYHGLVLDGICACLDRISTSFATGVERLNNRLRSQLRLSVNSCIDVLCEIVRCCTKASSPTPDTASKMETVGKISPSGSPLGPPSATAPAPQPPQQPVSFYAWAPGDVRRLYRCLLHCREEGFGGTGRWRGDPFEEIFAIVERRAEALGFTGESGKHAHDGEIAADTEHNILPDAANAPAAAAAKKRGGGNGRSAQEPNLTVYSDELHRADSSFGSASVTMESLEKALTTQWTAYLRGMLQDNALAREDQRFASAAGVVMRSGDRGRNFMMRLFHSIPFYGYENLSRSLLLIRQLVVLNEDCVADHSIFLGYENIGNEDPSLAFDMDTAARQSLLARWTGDTSLETPTPLIGLLTNTVASRHPEIRTRALKACEALLQNGHRGVQESFYRFCKRSPDETIFITVRNHLSLFLDELKTYYHALRRGSTDAAAARFLVHMDETTLHLALLQQFCAGQYAPLQTYLVAQPDNHVSVNLIESLVDLVAMSPMTASPSTTPFFAQLLSTISETLQGPCTLNQDNFVANKVAGYLTQLLVENREPPSKRQAILEGYEFQQPVEHRNPLRTWLRAQVRHFCCCCVHPRGCGCCHLDPDGDDDLGSETDSDSDEDEAEKAYARRRRDSDRCCPPCCYRCCDRKAEKDKEERDQERRKRRAERQRRAVLRMHSAALSTLLSLIEGRQDPAFTSRVLETVDLTILAHRMDRSAALYESRHGSIHRERSRGLYSFDLARGWSIFKRYMRDYVYDDHPVGTLEVNDELALGVNIYTFFRACYDMQSLAAAKHARRGGGTFEEYVDVKGRTLRQVLRKTQYYLPLGEKLGKVEIVRNGTLENVYFRILSASIDNFNRLARDAVIQDAVRSSDNERIQFFFSRTAEVMVELDHYAALRPYPAFFLINHYALEINLVALALDVVINFLMFIGIRTPTSPYGTGGTPVGIDRAIFGIGIALIIVQAVLVIQAFTGPALVSVATGWQKWRNERQDEIVQRERVEIAYSRAELFRRYEDTLHPAWYEKVFWTCFFVCTNSTFVEQVFFCFVCIMGLAHHRIWYSLQLMQILINSPALTNIIMALWGNISQLIFTLVLLVFVIFFFTTISYYKFSSLFNPLGDYGNGMNCYSMAQCWLVHVDAGLRTGGGIGDYAEWPVFFTKDGFGFWFGFFRIAYFVIVMLVVSNLFFGIIVDSLTAFREEQEFINTDQQKKCFICGIERNVFDLVQPGTYDRHISEEQNMWQYIFFVHYLLKKPPGTLTGQEAYVLQMFNARDVSFYPIGRSIILDSANEPLDDDDDGDALPAPDAAALAVGQYRLQAPDSTGGDGGAASPETELMVRHAVDPLREKLDRMEALLRALAHDRGLAQPTHRSNNSIAPSNTNSNGPQYDAL